MKKKGKVIFIGLDGVPYEMIRDFADNGLMPNIERLIDRGIFIRMSSSIPAISSVAWSSIITGKNPGRHGIFGFSDLRPGSYALRFPNFSDLKASTFWDTETFQSIIMNVPSTYPVRQMNGIHISGFVSIDPNKSVYPSSLISTLKELDYRIDVDSAKARQSTELFLADLDKTLEARIRACRYLWKNEDWRLFMLVFTGTDRLMHFLWDAYEDAGHRHHEDFERHFWIIDDIIGEIEGQISEEDLLIIGSDHGFEKLEADVHINYILKKEGFLHFKESAEPMLGNIDWPTTAFALDPARVYVNLQGRYPNGSVRKNDRGKVLEDLKSLFESLELDGCKVIRAVYRKEEIYDGPSIEQAPDLILIGGPGFNLRANPKAETLYSIDIFTGKHTLDNAFLLVAGPTDASAIPRRLSVSNVRDIVEKNLSPD